MSHTTPVYGWQQLRSLHSRFVDWLAEQHADDRDEVLRAMRGVTFAHWLLATHRTGVASIVTHLDDQGVVHVGMRLNTLDGPLMLFWLPAAQLGLSDDVAFALNVDAMLHELNLPD